MYLDEAVREWQNNLKTHYFIDNTILDYLLFADDQLVLADSEDNLQRAVHLLRIVANKYNLKISHRKTKVFGFCGNNTIRTKIVIEDKMIEQVNSFTYLGCDLSYISSTDVENKLNKFLRLIGTIKRTLINKVDRQTVLKFYKTLAIPTLLYGSETWILTRAQQRRIEAAEMRLLRPLAGFRLQDHKRNEDIRQELNVESVITIIEKYRNNWYDHITRMPNDRIPFRTWCYRPIRKRRVGRPKRRWRDQFDG